MCWMDAWFVAVAELGNSLLSQIGAGGFAAAGDVGATADDSHATLLRTVKIAPATPRAGVKAAAVRHMLPVAKLA